MSYFGDAINLLPRDAVRTTFQQANMRCGRRVDYTNLPKYRNGQHPSEALVKEWIPLLAQVCGVDEGVLWRAWRTDAASRQSAQRRSTVLSAFQQLAVADQRQLLDKLHRLSEGFDGDLPARKDFRLAIEMAPTKLLGWNRLNVRSQWTGVMPRGASVTATASYEELEGAYSDPSCIYRELIPGGESELADVYDRLELPLPVLRCLSDGTDVRMEAKPVGDRPGKYVFPNEPIENARFHLFAAFPYPTDVACYPVFLNRYTIQGRAYITVNLNRIDCRWMEAFLYGFHSNAKSHIDDPGDFERLVTIGDEESVLPQGVGAVFFWLAAATE